AETERVAGFVSGKLTNSLERRLIKRRWLFLAVFIRRQQSFEDQVVLTVAQRANSHSGFDDLPCPRIYDRIADTPAARRTVDPVDHVVSDIHRILAVRQYGHLKSIPEAGRFERLIPPTCAVDQRLPDVL